MIKFPSSAKDFIRNERYGTGFLLLFFLVFALSVLHAVSLYSGYNNFLKTEKDAFLDKIPVFHFSKGKLSCECAEQPMIYSNDDAGVVIIDTRENYIQTLEAAREQYADRFVEGEPEILLTRDYLIYKKSAVEVRQYNFSELEDVQDMTLDRNFYEWVFSKIDLFLKISLFPGILFFMFIWKMMQVLVFWLFGKLVAQRSVHDIALFRIAVFSIVPMTVINSVLAAIHQPLPYSFGVSLIVSILIVIWGVQTAKRA